MCLTALWLTPPRTELRYSTKFVAQTKTEVQIVERLVNKDVIREVIRTEPSGVRVEERIIERNSVDNSSIKVEKQEKVEKATEIVYSTAKTNYSLGLAFVLPLDLASYLELPLDTLRLSGGVRLGQTEIKLIGGLTYSLLEYNLQDVSIGVEYNF